MEGLENISFIASDFLVCLGKTEFKLTDRYSLKKESIFLFNRPFSLTLLLLFLIYKP